MTLEEIIECLNKHIQDKREQLKLRNKEFLVLQKSFTQHSQFKAYKEHNFILWLVKRGEKIPVLTINHVARVVDGNVEQVNKRISQELVKKVFELVNSDIFETIINGTYILE